MKKKERKKKKSLKKIKETKIHAIRCFPAGSFAVRIGDHVRFGIICGPIWGSFAVWRSFAVGDHLRVVTLYMIPYNVPLYKFILLSWGSLTTLLPWATFDTLTTWET